MANLVTAAVLLAVTAWSAQQRPVGNSASPAGVLVSDQADTKPATANPGPQRVSAERPPASQARNVAERADPAAKGSPLRQVSYQPGAAAK